MCTLKARLENGNVLNYSSSLGFGHQGLINDVKQLESAYEQAKVIHNKFHKIKSLELYGDGILKQIIPFTA